MYKSFKVSNMWRTFQWMLFSNRRQLTIFFIGIYMSAMPIFQIECLMIQVPFSLLF
mgnify:CR=1 FL=1